MPDICPTRTREPGSSEEASEERRRPQLFGIFVEHYLLVIAHGGGKSHTNLGFHMNITYECFIFQHAMFDYHYRYDCSGKIAMMFFMLIDSFKVWNLRSWVICCILRMLSLFFGARNSLRSWCEQSMPKGDMTSVVSKTFFGTHILRCKVCSPEVSRAKDEPLFGPILRSNFEARLQGPCSTGQTLEPGAQSTLAQ